MAEPAASVEKPKKARKFSRRRFLAASVLSTPLIAFADAKWVEPNWVTVRRISLTASKKPAHRILQVSDIHHKGNRAFLQEVVRRINEQSPDLVLFTGDLIEEAHYLPEALELMAGIKSPIYGVPGNHDYWSKAPFDKFARCFEATGGAWLMDRSITAAGGKICIHGITCMGRKSATLQLVPGIKNILLMHYPMWVEKLTQTGWDLILAGHSHGGQVRIPFYGAPVVPFGVGRYQLGMFETPAGRLYVNPGIGWFPIPIRFNCRPEITVFEI
jgi:predicted MPP superfamily phosphohydrolase